MLPDRREVTFRELLLAALGAALLAVVMHWPLPLHLGETIPADLGDPLPQSWQVAWGGHALTEQPFEFFQSNQFWPEPDSLAFGDALIGYAPAGLIGEGPHAAVVRYDLLFLFAYALCFFGGYWLGRELGLGPGGAIVAGAAFAYAPFRLEQDGHMQVISSGGIPLTLALGVRALRLQRPWLLIAAALVAAWQVSIGFAVGLPFTYLLALLAAIGAIVWWRRGRPALDRRMLIAGLAGAAIFVAIVGLISLPYFRVADAYPEATRPPSTVEEFSGPLSVFLLSSEENWVWGDVTQGLFDEVNNPVEKTLFPGLLILVLAIVGLRSSSLPRRLRIGLGVGVLGLAVLELGFQEEGGWLWPYRVVYDLLPGWEAIRTPGRLATFSTLALALLAGAGAESTVRAARRRLARRTPPASATASRAVAAGLAGVLALAIVIEGRGPPVRPHRPAGSACARRRAALGRRRPGPPASPARRGGRGQPPLSVLVHRRLPADRQRARQHPPRLDRAADPRDARLPGRRHRRPPARVRRAQRRPPHRPFDRLAPVRRRVQAGQGAGPEGQQARPAGDLRAEPSAGSGAEGEAGDSSSASPGSPG